MIKCPNCHSSAIGHIRMDHDWGSGGDYTKVNDCGVYPEEDIRCFDNNQRPNIDCYICCKCNCHFDEFFITNRTAEESSVVATKKTKEIRRLRDLIIAISDTINCNEYGVDQAIVDVSRLIDSEISLPNAQDNWAPSEATSADDTRSGESAC